jgi:branched-subunit amino acid transport protein
MSSSFEWWAVILVVGALNFLSRLSFIALFAHFEMPPLVARGLRFVPAAMLTAIVVPRSHSPPGHWLSYIIESRRAAVAAVVAWREPP